MITVNNNDTFTTKRKKERIVPINNTLLMMLQNRMPRVIDINNSKFEFQKLPGVPYPQDFITKQFKKVIRELGINDKIRLHSLRHSRASNLAQANVSLYIIKEILGHQDNSTTQIYSHLQKENLTNAVKVLDNIQ